MKEGLEAAGKNALYCDTDSVVYLYKPGEGEIKTGEMLGDWEPEMSSGDYIKKYCATGPKSYAYQTAKGKQDVKCKGMTLHCNNLAKVNYDTYKAAIDESLSGVQGVSTKGEQMVFKKSTQGMQTVHSDKLLSFDHTKFKRVVHTDYTTTPKSMQCEM